MQQSHFPNRRIKEPERSRKEELRKREKSSIFALTIIVETYKTP
ncbi:hypothetical protein HMPREF1869_00081 [Bacteroidales bacterium KA00251]|nr:hypothetical protein HMPREF1869_00081 [Bacteroidales bacterium KA00251]